MTQQQKNKRSNKKMGKGPEQTLLPRGYTNGQQVYEKMFNITSYQGNANQNHNEVLLHTQEDGYYKQNIAKRWTRPKCPFAGNG